MRLDHFVLVQKRQLAVHFQHPLDDEHHIRTACVIFVKHDGRRVAQGPRQDAFLKLGDLHAVFQLDRVLADQVNPGDVAVEVYPHARPVQARRHLFDMGGFARAVIALDHHAAVMGEACKDREGGVAVELVGAVQLWHAVGAVCEGLDLHVAVNSEDLADRDLLSGFCAQIDAAIRHCLVL